MLERIYGEINSAHYHRSLKEHLNIFNLKGPVCNINGNKVVLYAIDIMHVYLWWDKLDKNQ